MNVTKLILFRRSMQQIVRRICKFEKLLFEKFYDTIVRSYIDIID